MVTIVIGNGFDLNLMLRTSYSDFAKSKEFRELSQSDFFCEYVQTDNKDRSLWAHLQAVFDKQNWFDIEEEIYSFAKIKRERPLVLSQEFELIKKALQLYIVRIVNCTSVSKNSLAYKFMNDVVQKCTSEIKIYSFNYTDCLRMCDVSNCNHVVQYNIHGDLASDIALGYYDYKNEISDNSYSFMDKSFMLKNSGFNMAQNLIDSDEVIFFGHSLNLMDFSFFKSYFDYISNLSYEDNKSLTFVTLDDNSMRSIKEALKTQGYDIRNLHDRLNKFDFIRTHTWNERNIEDVTVYEQLLSRITK